MTADHTPANPTLCCTATNRLWPSSANHTRDNPHTSAGVVEQCKSPNSPDAYTHKHAALYKLLSSACVPRFARVKVSVLMDMDSSAWLYTTTQQGP